jgi:hypothetical protein
MSGPKTFNPSRMYIMLLELAADTLETSSIVEVFYGTVTVKFLVTKKRKKKFRMVENEEI